MNDMELKIKRIKLEQELEMFKIRYTSVLKELAIRHLDVDDLIEMINQIKEDKSDYRMLDVVNHLKDDLETIAELMRYKESYENKIEAFEYDIKHLEDDYIE